MGSESQKLPENDVDVQAKEGMSRRSFIVGGTAIGTAAIGAGLLAGCSPSSSSSSSSSLSAGTTGTADKNGNVKAQWWWETAPDPISDGEIVETKTADIVVVGLGNSGVMALLAAAEGGASVIGIEKAAEDAHFVGANKMALMNNISVTEAQGIHFTDDDRRKAIWELLKCGSERPDYRFYKQWMNDGGEFFNWLSGITDEAGIQWEMHEWPYPEGYDVERENYKHYPCAIACDTASLLNAMISKAAGLGAQTFYSSPAEQLVRDDNNTGRVSAVIAKNADGDYVKYVGTKGIIMGSSPFLVGSTTL